MLYYCFSCGMSAFSAPCTICKPDGLDFQVPLDPKYYPEFQYVSKGFVKDLIVKRKEQQKLSSKLDKVLQKYAEFENPYFVNYVHIASQEEEDLADPTTYSDLELFTGVLVRLGFSELKEYPELTNKLVRSTAFRFLYKALVQWMEHHISSNLAGTLKSYIEERGASFRSDLPLLLYYCWCEKKFIDEVNFSDNVMPLVGSSELKRIQERCERIYFHTLVERFKIKLERFDPAQFVTMYAVDSMDGFEFEDFLANLFTTLGYDVQTTKRSADQGADLFVTKFGQNIVIQAKNYMDNVGNSAVQQVLAAKTFYSCDQAMVVTNSYFTPSAKELAHSAGVRLVDRRELQSYVDEYNRTILEAADTSDLESTTATDEVIDLVDET